MNNPEVLIIGRANVGKSGIFNAIVGKRQALISNIAGTTRDINVATISWKNALFVLGDSAGLENLERVAACLSRPSKEKNKKLANKSKTVDGESTPLEHLIELKTLEHLTKASVRILVVDAETGLMPQDRAIMKFLRAHNHSFALAVNKVDGKNDEEKAEEFLRLHIKPTILVSSITRRGIGDLLDYIANSLPSSVNNTSPSKLPHTKRAIKVALIGKTNVGKSTLTNTLSETNEMVVSSSPHTTREPHAVFLPIDDTYSLELIDTAGVRKKAKIEHFLEIAGVRMSLEKLKHADVVIFLIDMSENLSSQDLALARLISENRRSCIIVGNKWDLIKRRAIHDTAHRTQRHTNKQTPEPGNVLRAASYEQYIRKALPKLSYAPILLISAKESYNTSPLKPLIRQVYENTYHIFPEHDINVILQKSLKLQPPPIVGEKKRKVQVSGLFQNSKNPKEYILKVYTRDYVPPNFVKFIEKQLKTNLPLEGIPVYITVENTREG